MVGVGSLTAQPAGVHVQALAQTRFFSLRTAALSQRRRWSRLSQQALAQHVGSAREVAVRVLSELREEGLIKTSRDEIVTVDPAHLAAQTRQP